MPLRWKVVLGIVSVPISTYIAVTAWVYSSFFLRLAGRALSARDLLGDVALIGNFAALIATAVAIVFGLPTFFWFRNRGWLSLKLTAAAGFILGVAPFLVLFIRGSFLAVRRGLRMGAGHPHFGVAVELKNLAAEIPIGLWWLLLGGFSGALSALGFWAIVLRRPRSS